MTSRNATLIAVAAALMGLALAAQQLPNEDNLSPAEKRIPPFHYCKKSTVTITKNEKTAHPCDCKYSCSVDAQGNVTEHESVECLAYCQKNGRRCTCHVEEPCDPKGHALMDMDYHILALPRTDAPAQP